MIFFSFVSVNIQHGSKSSFHCKKKKSHLCLLGLLSLSIYGCLMPAIENKMEGNTAIYTNILYRKKQIWMTSSYVQSLKLESEFVDDLLLFTPLFPLFLFICCCCLFVLISPTMKSSNSLLFNLSAVLINMEDSLLRYMKNTKWILSRDWVVQQCVTKTK